MEFWNRRRLYIHGDINNLASMLWEAERHRRWSSWRQPQGCNCRLIQTYILFDRNHLGLKLFDLEDIRQGGTGMYRQGHQRPFSWFDKVEDTNFKNKQTSLKCHNWEYHELMCIYLAILLVILLVTKCSPYRVPGSNPSTQLASQPPQFWLGLPSD